MLICPSDMQFFYVPLTANKKDTQVINMKEVEVRMLYCVVVVMFCIVAPAQCFAVDEAMAASPRMVMVNASQRFQEFYGSGAAFTGSSTFLFMNRLNSSARAALFRRLFGAHSSRDNGVSFSAMRIVMGTCDFNLLNYTYDDLPKGVATDYNLAYFSIQKDMEYVIPSIKEALVVNPHIKIVASPWSAPAWMKTPQTLFGGNLSTSLQVRQTYAKYFRKYVEAYRAAGIPIYAVTVQNEPRYETGAYPSMGLTPQDEIQMSLLIAKEFENSTIINGSTKVLVYDHNWDDPQYPIDVLSNSDVNASKTIVGAAFHCYAGNVNAQKTVHAAVPSKGIYFTECCGGAWAPDFSANLIWDSQNLVMGAVNGWARTVTKWNMALDDTCGPHLPSACTNCWGLMTISPNGGVSYQEDFYSLAHLNVFLDPSGTSRRVSVSDEVNTLAFHVTTSSNSTAVVVLVLNPVPATQNVSVAIANGGHQCTVNVTLPPSSLATLSHNGVEGFAKWVLTSGDKRFLLKEMQPALVTCTSALG